MVASTKPTKRIKVTFPQPMFDLLVADVPRSKRSAFIVAATEEALRRKLLELGPDSPYRLSRCARASPKRSPPAASAIPDQRAPGPAATKVDVMAKK